MRKIHRCFNTITPALAVTLALLTGCDLNANPDPGPAAVLFADTVLRDGKIYTQNPEQPWAEAMAITNGKFSYIGDNEGLAVFVGENTERIDLKGRMAMPGLFDAHVHPVLGGTEIALQCLFPPSAGPNEISARLGQCAKDNPDSNWIVGGRWDSNFFARHKIKSPLQWLDNSSHGKAISLADDTGHNRWVNSKALKLAGLNADSQISGGKVVKDANGNPTGVLLEAAMQPVLEMIPDWTPKQYRKAARQSIRTANAFGITGIKEAGDADQGVKAYKALDDAGDMTAHMAVSIVIPLVKGSLELDTARLSALREENRGHNVNTDYVKIFIDGVPSVARTGAMLNNYMPEQHGGDAHSGELLVPPEVLAGWITRLDAMGITVMVHTAGDRAVRVTLDAIEQARKINGHSGLRHVTAHSGFIDEADLPRYKQLNAVADMSPSIWYPSPITDSIISAVGERGKHYWPVKNLLEAGAQVIAGSDWPAVVPNMNPWPGIEALVTRKNPLVDYPGSLWPEQAINLEQAITIYTMGGARALKMDTLTGSIEKGKLADLIVLNQNIFEISPEKISDTTVELTLFEGKPVHRR
jgi:predicted amidohydrolase YtcJ